MAIWLIKYRYIFRYENAIFHARFIAYDINTFNNHNFQPLTTFQRKKKVEKIDPSLIPRSLPRMDGTFPIPYSITDVEPPLTANPFFQPMVLKESTPSDKAAREIPFRPFPGFHVKGVKGVNLDGGLEATKRIPPRRFDACRGYNRIPSSSASFNRASARTPSHQLPAEAADANPRERNEACESCA